MSAEPSALALLEQFGLTEFRPGQERVIGILAAGRSALAIFPTGAGKSLCFQLPALGFDGLTIVVSPLLALMKDQVDALQARGVAAERLDSSQGLEEARRVGAGVRTGAVKILYVSPERFSNERFVSGLKGRQISLVAVDEAHCISEWGHNFRPDYLKLAQHCRDLRAERVLALTATAPPAIVDEIAKGFGVAAGDVVNLGVYRKNLALHATPSRMEERPALLVERFRQRPPGAAIVYVTLQKTAVAVAARLNSSGFPARAYHAGMKTEEREAVQEWFAKTPDAIVAATIAFGMGIDKRDLRYVYHYNLPKTIENYSQEIGRAGRDGEPAVCEIFAAPTDVVTLENFTYGDTPTETAIAGVLGEVFDAGAEIELPLYDLAWKHDVRPLPLETMLVYLELDGLIAATGTKFAEVHFKPHRSSKEMLAGFDEDRTAFLKRIFAKARKAATWFHLDVDAAAQASGDSRLRIMTALDYLADRGDLTLKTAGARQCYRILKRPNDRPALVQALRTKFHGRERRDVARVRAVFEFAHAPGCLTRRLTEYFGEPLAQDCGHCGWCLGERPTPPSAAPPRDFDAVPAAVWTEPEAPALAEPRQRARFLCGLNSPAAVKQRVHKHPNFGVLADAPFGEVLRRLEAVANEK